MNEQRSQSTQTVDSEPAHLSYQGWQDYYRMLKIMRLREATGPSRVPASLRPSTEQIEAMRNRAEQLLTDRMFPRSPG